MSLVAVPGMVSVNGTELAILANLADRALNDGRRLDDLQRKVLAALVDAHCSGGIRAEQWDSTSAVKTFLCRSSKRRPPFNTWSARLARIASSVPLIDTIPGTACRLIAQESYTRLG